MRTDRGNHDLRPVQVTRGYTEMTAGSALFYLGSTHAYEHLQLAGRRHGQQSRQLVAKRRHRGELLE